MAGLGGHTVPKACDNSPYPGQRCPCHYDSAGPAALVLGLTLPCPVPSFSSSTLYHSHNKARFAESLLRRQPQVWKAPAPAGVDITKDSSGTTCHCCSYWTPNITGWETGSQQHCRQWG